MATATTLLLLAGGAAAGYGASQLMKGGGGGSTPAIAPVRPQPTPATKPQPKQAFKSAGQERAEQMQKLRKRRTLATSQRLGEEPMLKTSQLGISGR